MIFPWIPDTDIYQQINNQILTQSEYIIKYIKWRKWLQKEKEKIYDKNGKIKKDAWILKIRPCPYRLERREVTIYNAFSPIPIKYFIFIVPEAGWIQSPFFPVYGPRFHPGGAIELREDLKDEKVNRNGNQCIYNSCGELLKSIPSAGTADWFSPFFWGAEEHKKQDIIPFELAKDFGEIEEYYNVRPHVWLDEDGKLHINKDIFNE